ncbi:hypothetical protein Micbo1qcDRAFT_155270, partial [Microdochium bolleyi]
MRIELAGRRQEPQLLLWLRGRGLSHLSKVYDTVAQHTSSGNHQMRSLAGVCSSCEVFS